MAVKTKKAEAKETPTNTPLPESLASVIEGLSLGSEAQGSDIRSYISTQCAQLNYIIGRPGIPEGRLTTIFGKEGGAKSTTLQHILAENQRNGGISILGDAERRFSRDRAVRIGLDVDNLLFLKSRTLEQVFTDMEDVVARIRSRDSLIPVVIGLDSLAALPPGKVLEEDMNKSLPALVARFVSLVFPRILPWFADNNITFVVINQTRKHINFDANPRSKEVRKVMGQGAAMIAENALVFWSSVMLHLSSAGLMGDADEAEGIEVRAACKKNSVGPEGKMCEFPVRFLDGIDDVTSKLNLLEQLDIIKQSGGWYSYEPYGKKFRGTDFAPVLAECPELVQLSAEAPLLWITGG